MPGRSTAAVIEVGVAIVQDTDGRVLMAERRMNQLSPGFWELPGGKVELGETPAAAARRELFEETGLETGFSEPFAIHLHRFPTRLVRLNLFRMPHRSGTAVGREGQRVAWVDPVAPAVGPILPSNMRVMSLLGLPPTIYSTRPNAEGCEHAIVAARRSSGGDNRCAVLLRRSGAAPGQRLGFARRLAAALPGGQSQVWISGTASEAVQAGSGVLHSPVEVLRRATTRPATFLWAVSCHDEADLARAQMLGADIAIVSRQDARTSHQPSGSFGWEAFGRLAAKARLPVYAQGALNPSDCSRARAAGAAGIVICLDRLARAGAVQVNAVGERA